MSGTRPGTDGGVEPEDGRRRKEKWGPYGQRNYEDPCENEGQKRVRQG